jgi:signal transduction histidine kinase
MRPSSLTTRLLFSAGAWSLIVLVATGLVLSSLYRGAVERAFDERLDVFVKGLIAELAFGEAGTLEIARDLPEPRFSFPLSGWYWQVESLEPGASGSVASPSLLDQRLNFSTVPAPDLDGGISDGGSSAFYIVGPDGEELRVVRRPIRFQASEAPLLFTVAGNASDISAAARSFNGTLFLALSILGAGLVIAAFLQVRYGLRPVRELRAALARIRAGHERRITGDYPDEIAPLSNEVNALLDANEEVIERARTHVGNLAHALKTPLSVLANEAAGTCDPIGDKVEEQVLLMRRHVDHHLERARVAASANVLGAATDVEPVVASIVRTLRKINGERQIVVAVTCDDDVRFRGEKQDLEEMVGNLLDNAFKWADQQISVRIARNGERIDGLDHALTIDIDDDGPGLTEEQRQDALRRGRRLDESKPGSGLGLAIVADIATMYRGTFALGHASLGGLRARLVLPAQALN